MQNFLLRHRFAVTFFAGICIGTGYANIAYRYQAALPEIYNQHYLSAYADITMNYYALWKYIIRYRFRDLLLIGMMGLTAFRKYLIAFYIAYLGICAGMLVSTSVMYYGLAGIGLYLGCAAVYSVWNSAVFFVPNVLCSSSDRKKCTYDCGNCCDSGRGRNVYGSVL